MVAYKRSLGALALKVALAARQVKEGELATMPMEFEFHLQFPCGRPSNELSNLHHQHDAEMSANVKKKKKTCAKGNDFIANVISANQGFASTFSMQIFKFQRRRCKLSFLFQPCHQSAQESLLAGYYKR